MVKIPESESLAWFVMHFSSKEDMSVLQGAAMTPKSQP
jgi:hypothetical protein